MRPDWCWAGSGSAVAGCVPGAPAHGVSASAAAGDGSGRAGADPAVPELIRPCAQVGAGQTQVAEATGQAQKSVLSLELGSEAAQLILTGFVVMKTLFICM